MNSKIRKKIENSHKEFVTHSWSYEGFQYDWMEDTKFISVWSEFGWKADEIEIPLPIDEIHKNTILDYIYDWAMDKPEEEDEDEL